MQKAVDAESQEDWKCIQAVEIYFMCVVLSSPSHLHPERRSNLNRCVVLLMCMPKRSMLALPPAAELSSAASSVNATAQTADGHRHDACSKHARATGSETGTAWHSQQVCQAKYTDLLLLQCLDAR